MKTPEDEAFDDLSRKQGMWGGGFTAKRQAAMDKINTEFHEEYIKYRTAFPKEYTAPQPAQEPVGEIRASSYGHYPVVAWVNGYVAKIGDKFYTTPPQRPWVGLTDEEKGWCAAPTYVETVSRIEAKLKEKNT